MAEPGPPVGTRPTIRPAPAVAGLFAAVLLAGISPVFFVDWGADVAAPLNVLLALSLVLFSSYRLVGVITSDRPDMIRGFFYVFVFIFLGMASLAQTVAGAWPLDGRTYDDDVISRGLLTFVVAIAAYEAGWVLARRRGARRAEPDDGDPVRPPAPARPRLWFSPARTLVLGVVGLGATAIQVASAGVASFFISREATSAALFGRGDGPQNYQADDKAAGILSTFIAQYPVFIALFVILYCRHHKLWPKPSSLASDALWRVLIVALVGANVVMNNPMGNGRMWFCLVLVAFVSIYLPFGRPGATRVYVAGALVVLFFFFTSLDAFRRTAEDSDTAAPSGPQTSLVTDGSYPAFQMELSGILWTDRNGHTLGEQMTGAVLTFVPRKFWHGKPGPTGQLVDDRYLRSASLWTEAEVDFGVLGVLVVFALYGAASARATDISRTVGPGVVHAVVPILAVYQIFLLRGSLQPAMGTFYSLLLALGVVTGVGLFRARAGTRPPSRTQDLVTTGGAR